MKTLVMPPSMVTMVVVMMMIMTVKSQRRVVGDIREQSISQLADFDAREERVFRCVDIGLSYDTQNDFRIVKVRAFKAGLLQVDTYQIH